MLKKVVTYKDFDGNEVTETHYFNLSKAELVEMELSQNGGLGDYLKKIVEASDGKRIIEEFKNLLQKSYGKKSDDGRRFVKSRELWEEFASSEAYSTIFMEIVTNADAAASFVNGIMPQGMETELAMLSSQAAENGDVEPVYSDIADNTEPRRLSTAEILEMDEDELKSGLRTGRYLI